MVSQRSGANVAKFQHQAATIVSDAGFRALGSQIAHQSKWQKSVYDVYDEASLSVEWTSSLTTCDEAGITSSQLLTP